MKKMICFDMDGTIADLYAVENWLPKLRAEDASPYKNAAPMWEMKELRQVLLKLQNAGYEIRVISWLSKDSSKDYKNTVRIAKRAWLDYYGFPADHRHFVAYGTPKHSYMRRYTPAAILIDDNEQIRNKWNLGDVIDPLDGDLIEKLERLCPNEK